MLYFEYGKPSEIEYLEKWIVYKSTIVTRICFLSLLLFFVGHHLLERHPLPKRDECQ